MSAAEVDAHLAEVPEPHRTTLARLRTTLLELLPDGEECLKYGMPCITLGGKAVAGYEAFTRHCSYFPHSGGVLARVEGIPAGYATTKGTLQFPPDEPLAKALVKKLVRARLDELAEKAAAKRR